MRVLVTGGAGFIGSNIVFELVEKGFETYVVDSMHTGNEKNLEGVMDSVRLFKCGAGEIPSLSLPKVDFVLHYGIYSSSPMYKEDRRRVAEAIGDAITVFEFAKDCGSRVILCSTSSLYNGLPTPWREDAVPLVTDFYTEARIAIERLAELYHKLYGLNVITLRHFSIYGPKEEYKGQYANNITQFLWCMMKDKPPVIFGDGNQTRDFVYVKDAVEAAMRAMEKDIEYDVFNVGTGKDTSFNKIVEILNRKLGKNIKPKYVPNPIKNYVYKTQADPTKAEKILGFRAKTTLEEGIDKTIQYYKQLEWIPDV
ncbi:MAG: NAD-dependent epimerase/dehydratase family protein [Candidatus Jordarchaeales archaeon]|nr:NAD-dependent epimerase/dehydratase family protein [Candidatus Jordarchaeia archaeon]